MSYVDVLRALRDRLDEESRPGSPSSSRRREGIMITNAITNEDLLAVDAAMKRLEAGTFGGCERCGQSIPLGHLRAVPLARYCLPCQVREER